MEQGITRRALIAVLAGATGAVASRPSRARPARVPVIGCLGPLARENYTEQLTFFREGLRRQGFVEGDNIRIEQRWAGGDAKKLSALADELVQLRVDAIAAFGPTAAAAAAAATSTIPIVANSAAWFVESIGRPAGNVTGAGTRTQELTPKRLELLHAAVPNAALVAVLTDPESRFAAATGKLVANAARRLGLRLVTVEARRAEDFAGAFAQIARSGAGALLVMPNPFFFSQHRKIVALANRHRLPAIYEWGEIAQHGGLMGYGDSFHALFLRVGDYVGRILKGAKPSDLPVDLPAAIRLTVNLKTAREIGFTFPPSFLARADKVIE